MTVRILAEKIEYYQETGEWEHMGELVYVHPPRPAMAVAAAI